VARRPRIEIQRVVLVTVEEPMVVGLYEWMGKEGIHPIGTAVCNEKTFKACMPPKEAERIRRWALSQKGWIRSRSQDGYKEVHLPPPPHGSGD
jgi:hypothetical protein